MIKVEILAHSVGGPSGIELLTYKLRYPWFIHGEVMTHRVFSRNASSNRAVPLAKMLEEARSDELRAEPVKWGTEQRGMSPGGELHDDETRCIMGGEWASCTPRHAAKIQWRTAALQAADAAEKLGKLGLHKSLCNRLLMPFTHANVIVTSTEWDNFFGLRLDADADPTMRALAVAMWEAKEKSAPVALAPGQWHLPFVEPSDVKEIATAQRHDERLPPGPIVLNADGFEVCIKVSVARCARVSYESFETGRRSTVEEDLKLYDRLAAQGHWSPFEHQATSDEPGPTSGKDGNCYDCGNPAWDYQNQHGNLRGWRQYRQMMEGQAVKQLPPQYRSE